ncbi:hypothetical protein ACFX19_044554 [Malus domestica]
MWIVKTQNPATPIWIHTTFVLDPVCGSSSPPASAKDNWVGSHGSQVRPSLLQNSPNYDLFLHSQCTPTPSSSCSSSWRQGSPPSNLKMGRLGLGYGGEWWVVYGGGPEGGEDCMEIRRLFGLGYGRE